MTAMVSMYIYTWCRALFFKENNKYLIVIHKNVQFTNLTRKRFGFVVRFETSTIATTKITVMYL